MKRQSLVSQRQLALRACTTQAAVSRIERGLVSPTFTTLRELMIAMGEEPVLEGRRLGTRWDEAHMRSTLARRPDERLRFGAVLEPDGFAAGRSRARRPRRWLSPTSTRRANFAVLAEHRVDYVVVGGVAVQVHGHVRMTNDLDLIPAPDRANLTRLAEALNELEGPVLNPGSEKLRISTSMLARATHWQLERVRGYRPPSRRSGRRPFR